MAKVRVCDISGMGGREHGGYEWGCQVIALRTVRFLQNLKSGSEVPTYQGFENVVGLTLPHNEPAKEMDKFILDHPALKEFGVTGAMHQYGVAHGKAIFEKGREQYEKELREAGRTDEDFYEIEEDDAFPEMAVAKK